MNMDPQARNVQDTLITSKAYFQKHIAALDEMSAVAESKNDTKIIAAQREDAEKMISDLEAYHEKALKRAGQLDVPLDTDAKARR